MTKIRVSSGFFGKLQSAPFESSQPSFYSEVEYESKNEGSALEDEIVAWQKQLHDISYRNFKIVADKIHTERLKNDMKNFRFYTTDNGEYPSVTTVIEPVFKSFCDEETLRLATAEGNVAHARAAHYIKTGKWADTKELEGVASDLLMLKGKFIDTWDFPAFLTKYPLAGMKNGEIVINHEHRYAGLPDGEGKYPLGGEKGAEIVPTLFDFKRTPDRDKNFTQCAAYSACLPHVKQMMIIPTNPDNQQGYSKPILTTAIDKYFEVFLDRRKKFQEIYGV